MTVTPLMVPAGPEMLIVLMILVLLFGANRIPELARSAGASIKEFERGKKEAEDELETLKDTPSSEAADDG